jgi:hypothetical protein
MPVQKLEELALVAKGHAFARLDMLRLTPPAMMPGRVHS